MTNYKKLALLLLRLSLGWLFFYAGYSKLINPNWSAIGYLKAAQTLTPFYQWLASPQNLPWVNFLNEWGLALIGVALILGVFVRLASIFGILLMVLYYLPVLKFPLVGSYSFLVDEHIIYIAAFLVLKKFDAGAYWGLKTWVQNLLPKPLAAYI